MRRKINNIIHYLKNLGRDRGEDIEIVVDIGNIPPPHIIVETKDGRSYCLVGEIMSPQGIRLLEPCVVIDLAPCQADITFNADIVWHH